MLINNNLKSELWIELSKCMSSRKQGLAVTGRHQALEMWVSWRSIQTSLWELCFCIVEGLLALWKQCYPRRFVLTLWLFVAQQNFPMGMRFCILVLSCILEYQKILYYFLVRYGLNIIITSPLKAQNLFQHLKYGKHDFPIGLWCCILVLFE